MWKTIITILLNVFGLARDLEENRKEIKDLNEKVYALAGAVRSLSDKLDANVQIGVAERKALVLQLQNELLMANHEIRTLNPTPMKNPPKKVSKSSQARIAK
jgi:archaellum component FlaC